MGVIAEAQIVELPAGGERTCRRRERPALVLRQELRTAYRIVKLFHCRYLDVAPKEREVIYVARKRDPLPPNAVVFHRSERVVDAKIGQFSLTW